MTVWPTVISSCRQRSLTGPLLASARLNPPTGVCQSLDPFSPFKLSRPRRFKVVVGSCWVGRQSGWIRRSRLRIMSCQTVADERYDVVIQIPKPFRTRCKEFWNAGMSATRWIVKTVFSLGLIFVIFGLVWVLNFCQGAPGMSLEAMSVQAMRPYENSTVAPPESPWQVSSVFNVKLSTWNPNTVAGCFCTFRRVIVRVEYRGQVIVHQEVPLGFGLKPQKTAPASFQVQGNGFPLQNPDLGPFMETELRTGNVSFDFYFDARYMRNDRKAGWLNLECHVMAQTPSNSSQVGDDGLLTQDCY